VRTHHSMTGTGNTIDNIENLVTSTTLGTTASGEVIVMNISTPQSPKVTNPSDEGIYSVPAITFATSNLGGEGENVLDFGMTALVPIGDFGSAIEADVDTTISFTISGTRIDLGSFNVGTPVLVETGTQLIVTTNDPTGYRVNVSAITPNGVLTK